MSEKEKICAICGDKAFFNNFGAMSCESCKIFFRRNAIKTNEFKCIYNEKCEINLETRKECRKCRLNKCFAIGMKNIWISNEKTLDKNKSENVFKKHQKINHFSKVDNLMTTQSSNSTMDSNSGEIDILSEILENNNINEKEINLTINEFLNTFNANIDINVTSDNVTQIESNSDLSVIPVIPRPITDYKNTFNELEGNLFTELEKANRQIRPVMTPFTLVANSFTDAIRALAVKTEVEMVNVVKLSTSLRAFDSICVDDRICLLKYGALEIMAIFSIYCYNSETECWTVPLEHGNSTLLNLRLLKSPEIDLYRDSRNFLQSLSREWDLDDIILNLLVPIILFDPKRPHLTHRKIIKLQQNIYLYLLKRYLQLRYRSESEANSKFNRLMNCLNFLRKMQSKYLREFLKSNSHIFSGLPMFQEIYDLMSSPHNSLTLTIEEHSTAQ